MKIKNKKIVIILLFLLLIPLTGCTKILKDENKKTVQNTKTGQNLVENILCQPEDSTTIEIYNQHNIEINNLPKCSNFKITSGGYEGI